MPVLTDRNVQQWKPTADGIEVPDSTLPGLYLIVQPTGVKSWAVRYRLAGKPAKYTIGRYPVLPLKTARDLAREALGKVSHGEAPSAAPAIEGTVRAAAELYRAKHLPIFGPQPGPMPAGNSTI
jgi:hypothetical protein